MVIQLLNWIGDNCKECKCVVTALDSLPLGQVILLVKKQLVEDIITHLPKHRVSLLWLPFRCLCCCAHIYLSFRLELITPREGVIDRQPIGVTEFLLVMSGCVMV